MRARLLVADDHPAIREMVGSLLQAHFDVIASVDNGQAAVEAILRLLPDVVILDVSMPILDGVQVATRVREHGCAAKIVFLSMSTDPQQIAACLAAGGEEYVSKIRMGTDLIDAVNGVLQQSSTAGTSET